MPFESVLNFFAALWSCIRGEDNGARGDNRKSSSRKSRREQAASGEEALNSGTANDRQTPQERNLTAAEKHLERLREPDKSFSSKKRRRNKAPDGSRESDDSWKKDEAALRDGNKAPASAWSGDFADCSLLAQIFLDDTTSDGETTVASSETRDNLTSGSEKTPGKSQEENASGRAGGPTRPRQVGTTCGLVPPVETARPKKTSGRMEKSQTLGSDVNGGADSVAEKTQQSRETGSGWRRLRFRKSAREEGTGVGSKYTDLRSPACADNQSLNRTQDNQGQNRAPDDQGHKRAQHNHGQEGVQRVERTDGVGKRYAKSVVTPRRLVQEQGTGFKGAESHCRGVKAAGQEEVAAPEVLKNPSHISASPDYLSAEWRTALREVEQVLAPVGTPWMTNRKVCEFGSLKIVHFDHVVPPNTGSVKIITPTWTPRHLVKVKPHQRRSKKVFLLPPIKEEPLSETESGGATKQRGELKTKKKSRASRDPSRQELADVGAQTPPKDLYKTSAPVSILGDSGVTPTLASDEGELVKAAGLAHNSATEFPITRAVEDPEREDASREKTVVELRRSRACCTLIVPKAEVLPALGTNEEDSAIIQAFSVPDLGDVSREKVAMVSTNDEPCALQTSCPLPPIPSCVRSPESVGDLSPKKNEPAETEASGLLTAEQPLAVRCEPTNIFSLDYLAAGRDLTKQSNTDGTWQSHRASNGADREAGASNLPGDPLVASDRSQTADTTKETRKKAKRRRRKRKGKRGKVGVDSPSPHLLVG